MVENAKHANLPIIIYDNLTTMEKNSHSPKGALLDNYYSRLGREIAKLSSLIDKINDIDTIKDKNRILLAGCINIFSVSLPLKKESASGEF